MPSPDRCLPTALAVALCAMAHSANAHDTWFEPLPSGKAGEVMLSLGTGNRFPVHEFSVGTASLVQSGCRNTTATVPLKAVRDTPTALVLRAPLKPPSPITCWAQQTPFEVEIKPETVDVYFKEINAPQATRAAWARMNARGVAWKERYSKHARIALGAAGTASAQPTGMAMDVLLESGDTTIRPGSALTFQVLRDGQPLPDFAVELRSDQSPLGFWKTTDAQGRVSFQPPLAGQWVLRGTDLRLSTAVPDTWESRFVTLAFEVKPAL
jgi:hypothetical protein